MYFKHAVKRELGESYEIIAAFKRCSKLFILKESIWQKYNSLTPKTIMTG